MPTLERYSCDVKLVVLFKALQENLKTLLAHVFCRLCVCVAEKTRMRNCIVVLYFCDIRERKGLSSDMYGRMEHPFIRHLLPVSHISVANEVLPSKWNELKCIYENADSPFVEQYLLSKEKKGREAISRRTEASNVQHSASLKK